MSYSILCRNIYLSDGELIVPEYIKKIPDDKFYHNRNFKTIYFEPRDFALTIGNRSFFECWLKELIIPPFVELIKSEAFQNNSNLKSLSFAPRPANNILTIEDCAFMYCGITGELMIPPFITEIGNRTFHHCNINKLIIPATVKKIGKYAFSSNQHLSVVIFEPRYDILIIKDRAFSDCNIAELIIPPDIDVDHRAFELSGAKKVVIPKHMLTLKEKIFIFGKKHIDIDFSEYCGAEHNKQRRKEFVKYIQQIKMKNIQKEPRSALLSKKIKTFSIILANVRIDWARHISSFI
jgi:hypothetical protein